jgi:hypothetical protein
MTTKVKRLLKHTFALAIGAAVLGSCSNKEFKKSSSTVQLGLPGARAGGMDSTLLASVHESTTARPPAAIRPDPDTHIRTLLRQYRPDGPLIAREIGRVEDYRPLLGGASEDFSKAPQLTYDATSLLAVQKVASEICTALINPGPEQLGWATILPEPPSQTEGNIRFLAQRFIGLPSSQISEATITALGEILDLSLEQGQATLGSYVPVCVALSLDAEALLL